MFKLACTLSYQQKCFLPFLNVIIQFLCQICMVFLDNIKNLTIKITAKSVKLLTNIKHKLNVIDTVANYKQSILCLVIV